MLISSRFRTINSRHILPLSRIPNSQLLFSKSISCSFSLNSKHFSVLFFQDSSMSSSSSTKIVAEYAKSNRSSCKKCSEKINAKALRLGFVSRDARGFDMTRWFHSDCVSFGSDPISSADSIQGFELLEGSDQEALKKLVTGSHQSKLQEEDGIENENEISIKSSRVQKRDENEANGLEEGDLKKAKLSMSSWQLDAVLEASDIKDKYKDATLLPNWKAFQTLIFLEQLDGLHHSSKIAAFDFDGCLANTSVKRSGPDAWSLMFRTIPDKLQSLYNDGYKLVIFTNESNIERWKNKRQTAVDSKLGRLNNFINEVNVPIQVFIACGLGKSIGKVEDPFRKPKSGMWEIMARHFNSDIPIDMDQSFYVGDAAGRVNDHSDADIKFAQAIGLKFYLPEEYFGKD